MIAEEAEETEETDNFSEAGTGASHWLVRDLGLQSSGLPTDGDSVL